MDALKAEIERKRKAKQELTGGRKWMRKGEIEQLEAQRYKDAQRAKAGEQPDAGPSSSSARRADAPAAAPDGGAQPAEEGLLPPNALPDLEVKKRLRALRHPITLFDEAVAARWLRYTKVEDELRLSQAATNSELRAGQLFNERQLDERRLNEAASAGADGGADAAAVAATLPRAAEGAAGAAGSAAGTDAAHPGAGADAAAAGAAAGGASARAAAAPEVLRELDAYFAARGGAGAGGGQAGKGAGVLRTLHALLTEWYDELSARTDEVRAARARAMPGERGLCGCLTSASRAAGRARSALGPRRRSAARAASRPLPPSRRPRATSGRSYRNSAPRPSQRTSSSTSLRSLPT